MRTAEHKFGMLHTYKTETIRAIEISTQVDKTLI